MNKLHLKKSLLSGSVKVPPSKSIAHRAIICAALGKETSIVENIDYSDDIIATISAMEELGAIIEKNPDSLNITGIFNEKAVRKNARDINCKESGSTLRFLVPISLLFDGISKFTGEGNLGKRPLDVYYNIFAEQGIKYNYTKDKLDLIIKGLLKPGTFTVPGNISSQFISGLLFALPLLKGDSKIIITTELESKGYLDLTISCMKDFGVEIINKDYKELIIKGNQSYKSRNYRVEGDYSQAAFYLVADLIGSKVKVKDLNLTSLQGDKAVIDILESMGAKFYKEEDGIGCTAPYEIKSTIIDGSQCPDIIPVLSVAAALAKGKTEIINAGRLRIKECDRLRAVASELNKIGAKIEEKEDGLVIYGVEEFKGGVDVWSWKDHRIAMTLAIASTRCKEAINLIDYDCVAKSYPSFFEDFKTLGGIADEWNMGK